MANEIYVGPLSYTVHAFPLGASIDAGLVLLLQRVDAGLIEILDLAIITTSEAGPRRLALARAHEVTPSDVSVLDGIESDVLDPDDIADIARALSAEEFALAIVYEDRTLAGTAHAWAQVGASELFVGGIDIEELEHAITEGAHP